MSEPTRGRATYEDLLALPDDVVGEILNGALHVGAADRARLRAPPVRRRATHAGGDGVALPPVRHAPSRRDA